MVTKPPYTYLSVLHLEGVPVAYSNGTVGDSIQVLANIEQLTPKCDDNTRLLWTELPEYNNINSWDSAGTGGIIDGALMMLFGLSTVLLLLRKR